MDVAYMLPGNEDPSLYGKFARRILTYHPQTTEATNLLQLLKNFGDGDVDNFISAGLEVYPPRIEWHQYYQNAEELLGNEAGLLETYRSRLENYPNSGAYAYLLGRITDDEVEATRLSLEAEEKGCVGGLGYNAIAYHYLTTGQFDQVMEYAELAFERNPNHPGIYSIYMTGLEAVGRYENLLEFDLARFSMEPDDVYNVQNTLYSGILSGRDDAAQEVVDRYFDITSGWMSHEERNFREYYFEISRAHNFQVFFPKYFLEMYTAGN